MSNPSKHRQSLSRLARGSRLRPRRLVSQGGTCRAQSRSPRAADSPGRGILGRNPFSVDCPKCQVRRRLCPAFRAGMGNCRARRQCHMDYRWIAWRGSECQVLELLRQIHSKCPVHLLMPRPPTLLPLAPHPDPGAPTDQCHHPLSPRLSCPSPPLRRR